MTLTQDRARQVLGYDPATGHLTWLLQRGRARVGDRAGCVATESDGRRVRTVRVDGKQFLEHRLIWFWVTGRWPEPEVDHRDRDATNNVWTNLREATRSQNRQNQLDAPGASGFLGVTWHAGKWAGQIHVDGKHVHLGRFDRADDGHAAYLARRAQAFPFQPTPARKAA